MTAREWKPGDKALVEVEVTWTDESTVQCSIAADDGYFLPINALRPLPAVGEAAAEAEVEAVARALARLEPGEDWPTNSALGGDPTGARDDEYRSAMRDQAREAIAAMDAVRARRKAEIKAEGWDEAVRECHSLRWLRDFALSDALTRNPYRAARSAGTTDTERTDHE